MEPSRKSHAILNSLYFCGTMPNDASESAATHSSKLHYQSFSCTSCNLYAALAVAPKFKNLRSGMEARVSLETIEPNDLMLLFQYYYFNDATHCSPCVFHMFVKCCSSRFPIIVVIFHNSRVSKLCHQSRGMSKTMV